MTRVDVIVPCYNYGRFLHDCVTSVLAQEGVDVRILILDDHSTDETPAVAAHLTAEDARVAYRRHDVNQGHIRTYNEGLAWVRNEYVVLLSADDMLTPGSFRRATALMSVHPEVAFTYGPPIRLVGDVSPRTLLSARWGSGNRIVSGREFLEASCASGNTNIQSPTVMVRTCVHKAVGGYREDLPHSGDTEIWLRFALRGAVGVIDAPQAFYRLHGANMVTGYPGLRGLVQQKAAFDAHFLECGYAIDRVDLLRQRLHRRLADDACRAAHVCFEAGQPDHCDECLRFALGCDQSVRSRPLWLKLRVKRAMGRTAWSWVADAWRAHRGDRRAFATPDTPSAGPSPSRSCQAV